MSGDAILDSYEAIPYAASSQWETHPDTVASVAAILGIDSPDIRTARVLEIGCATGGNLLPMATALPGAKFVGIDLSPRQIELGQRMVDALRLSNVSLQALDLMDFPADAGRFDYIICHGVYSWVPPAVRRRILELYSQHLSPTGIGYISFNTYPGWHLRKIARDMMTYHAEQYQTPQEKVSQARRILSIAADAVSGQDTPLAKIIADEARKIAGRPDQYVAHEHLDSINQPFHFHEFQRDLADFALTYLSESPVASSAWGRHGAKIQTALAQLPADPLAQEQYLDFLTNRVFRRSLVCHAQALPQRRLLPESLASLRFSAMVRPASSRPDITGTTAERFETGDGKTISTNNPLMKSILFCLARTWPNAASLDEMRAAIGGTDHCELPAVIIEFLLTGIVNTHQNPVSMATGISSHPRAFEYARTQAADGLSVVTNLRHRSVVLEGLDPAILALLDGHRDIPQVVAALEQRIKAGNINLGATTDSSQRKAALANYVPQALSRMHGGALLIA